MMLADRLSFDFFPGLFSVAIDLINDTDGCPRPVVGVSFGALCSRSFCGRWAAAAAPPGPAGQYPIQAVAIKI